jgi:hypothetical protein
MKVAAILALIVAVVLGAWAINDYRNQEEMKRDLVRQGVTTLALRLDSGENVQLDVWNISAYYERRDAKAGALSAAFLIGSIALFWSRSKAVTPADRK